MTNKSGYIETDENTEESKLSTETIKLENLMYKLNYGGCLKC